MSALVKILVTTPGPYESETAFDKFNFLAGKLGGSLHVKDHSVDAGVRRWVGFLELDTEDSRIDIAKGASIFRTIAEMSDDADRDMAMSFQGHKVPRVPGMKVLVLN